MTPERWHPTMPKATRHVLQRMMDEGYSIEVGDYSYGAPAVRWSPHEKKSHHLRIGKYCSLAADIDIYVGRQGRHPTDFLSTYPIGLIHGPLNPHSGDTSSAHEGDLSVTIASDVWIGRGAQIMAGVTIGAGAVVGARSLVTSDVPPYAIVLGAPTKVHRFRFEPEQVAALLRLRWWDLPQNVLADNVDIFNKRDINYVISRLEEMCNG